MSNCGNIFVMFFRNPVVRFVGSIPSTNFEGKKYFEIHDTCSNGIFQTLPDFGDFLHDWEACSPSDVICGLCLACRDKPADQQCKFKLFSDLVDTTYGRCCTHFKVYMFRSHLIENFTIRVHGKILCPLHETVPRICEIPIDQNVTVFQHLFANHLNHMSPPDFDCFKMDDVVRLIWYVEEAFLYYKRVEEGSLTVGMVRTGLSKRVFTVVVTFLSTAATNQYDCSVSFPFNVAYLLECSQSLEHKKEFLRKRLDELSDFIDAENNEIRMKVSLKRRPRLNIMPYF